MNTTLKNLREKARTSHAQYPQYAGHWDGPEWVLVRVTRRIRTKLGVAFERGELALARRTPPETDSSLSPAILAEMNRPSWTAYSVRNRADTQISLEAAREV